MSDEKKYPEHAKLRAVIRESQALCRFLVEHCPTKGWELVNGVSGAPVAQSAEYIAAEFFGLDRRALEAEKLAMLDEIRNGARVTPVPPPHVAVDPK